MRKIMILFSILIIVFTAISIKGITIEKENNDNEIVRFYVQAHLEGICTPTPNVHVFARSHDTGIEYDFSLDIQSLIYYADIPTGVYMIVVQGPEGYKDQSVENYEVTESNPDFPLHFTLPSPKSKDISRPTAKWFIARISGELQGVGSIGKRGPLGAYVKDISISGFINIRGLSINGKNYQIGDNLRLEVKHLIFGGIEIGDCLDPERIQISGIGIGVELYS